MRPSRWRPPAERRSEPVRRPSSAPAKASHAGAVVLGGDYRGLGIARSLGRRGIPVWILREGPYAVAARSRHAARSLAWREAPEQAQVDHLLDLGRRNGLEGWVIFATGDETAALLARHHAVLAELFALTVPPWDVFELAYDKRLTYRTAADAGLAVPWTRYPRDRDEVAALDAPFPVVLKPRFKARANRFTNDRAWRADDRRELLTRYDEARRLVEADMIMVQEFVPGDGTAQLSYAALCDEGRSVAAVTARRTRQYPIEFGRSSSYVETITDDELEACGRRLLERMRYAGLAEVEFKRDRGDGKLKVLDVNPRVWTWHTIGARAGVDFPYLAWRMLRGEGVSPVLGRAGTRWVYMATDAPVAAVHLARRRLRLRDYLRSIRPPVEFAVVAADDPLPLIAGPYRALRVFVRGVSSRLGSWLYRLFRRS